MELSSDKFFERLLLSYSDYFDIIRDTSYQNLPVAAEAAFHSRSEKYVLVKKAQLWAAEAHEYVFFVRVEHLDADTFRAYNTHLLEEGLSRVEPKKDHMYTYVTVLFLAESVAPEVPKLIARTRCHRDYRMSLYGWMDYRVAARDCASKKIFTNWAGRPLKKTFRSVMKKRRK
ncbi:MAG: hypothetical protein PUF59_09550 [Lachnospiraceae bacterium]|nr:hypothetical protein [Lachnospiraceae bacterium]